MRLRAHMVLGSRARDTLVLSNGKTVVVTDHSSRLSLSLYIYIYIYNL